uniref:diguanylate cyclase n=1 Tax=Microvirga sp. Mcv34 TaxID=2926016 RepID=UPI0021C64821
DGALAVAQTVRDALASARIAHPGGIGERLTTSIGLATVGPEDVESAKALVARADAALYRAKQEGRDRCIPWCAGE